jgi:hypothetical protein
VLHHQHLRQWLGERFMILGAMGQIEAGNFACPSFLKIVLLFKLQHFARVGPPANRAILRPADTGKKHDKVMALSLRG